MEDMPKKDKIVNVPQEYRLVPIDNPSTKSKEIDILQIINDLWQQRRFLIKVVLLGSAIGVLLVLLSPKNYQSSATLLPEDSGDQSGASGLLQKYGGLIGLGSGLNMEEGSSIPLQMYPEIVGSLPFQLQLLNEEVTFKSYDTTTTIYYFFNEVYRPSGLELIKEYTVGLPGKILSLFKKEEPLGELPRGFETDSILTITKKQMNLIDNLKGRVNISLDDGVGVIRLTVEMPDAYASADLTMKAVHLLRTYIINYKTRKANENLVFVEEKYEDAKRNFEEAQIELATFRDRNINLASSKARTQEQLLQSKYDLSFEIFTSLAQQLEQAKLTLQEQTPVMSILQPAKVPVEDTTSGLKIVIAFFVLSMFLGITYVFFQQYRKEIGKA